MHLSRITFEIQVGLAKKHGLKCLVIPSRIGNRFAGAPYMSSVSLLTGFAAAFLFDVSVFIIGKMLL